ncbi:NlpC/P60 family protein (plasmid) [Corynebacterium mustelae]|uniref:NlpC/P60 family protein n=1 Tax=Corynebacterium mustelae TaxID=571915 RepID=A0A0G3H1V4_9CORY|nr:peptidoglycan DD-metalloendopeptidase family protein [Corynebacterium mustelae]AKK07394.1 NlpC/P60 family protein [Corynebacterium mustelae]
MKKIVGVILAVVMFLVLVTTVFVSDDKDGRCLSPVGPARPGVFARPVDPDVPVTSGYGPRWGAFHHGVDFGGPQGAPIYAFADGTVSASQDQGVGGFGGWVIVDHEVDGKKLSTLYGHQDPGGNLVKVGDRVRAGQQIAKIGNSGQSTGPHLHFEVHEGGYFNGGHDVDPMTWLEKVGEKPAEDNEPHDEPAHDEDTRTLRARQIIARGHERGVGEKTIVAALSAALVESEMQMLASRKVPESLQYPNDGVAPGDYDSVGLFQTRVSIHGSRYGGVKGLMDPRTQIDWFYDAAEGASGDTPAELAANVERPAAQYRGRYQERLAEAEELYARLRKDSAGAGSVTVGNNCRPGQPVTFAGDVNAAILDAAKSQFGLPYVWGGGDHHGPTGGGFDCSGLTMYAVYQATGGSVAFDHHTDKQFDHPAMESVAWEDRQPGDLLFYRGNSTANPWEKYHHVAIYSGEKAGKPMQYEAQTYGVNSGEYPVRFGEQIEVRRVTTHETPKTQEEKDTNE